MNLLWVCAGGAVGTGARYLVSMWALERYGRGFPWGTLAVNVAGCLLLGFLARIGEKNASLSPAAYLAMTTGALGGFTTYSTFNLEVLGFLQRAEWRLAAGYLAATLLGGIAAGAAGYAAARAVAG